MSIEYEKIFTDGPKHTWERTAVNGVKRLWDEKWCKDCGGWRRVKYFYGERFCAVCFALDEWRMYIENEQWAECDHSELKWLINHPPSSKIVQVQCDCGMIGETVGVVDGEFWRCNSCAALVQETEESLRNGF